MLNDCKFMGRFCFNPEIKVSPNGTSILKNTLAVKKDLKGKADAKDADFVEVVFFGKLAETVVRYFKKGDFILITSSRATTHAWKDKEGNQKKSVEFVCNGFNFMPAQNKQTDSGENPASEQSPVDEYADYAELNEENDGDLPF